MFLCVEYIYDVIKVWRWKCIFHCSRRYYPNFCKLSVSLYFVYDMSLCLDILVMICGLSVSKYSGYDKLSVSRYSGYDMLSVSRYSVCDKWSVSRYSDKLSVCF